MSLDQVENTGEHCSWWEGFIQHNGYVQIKLAQHRIFILIRVFINYIDKQRNRVYHNKHHQSYWRNVTQSGLWTMSVVVCVFLFNGMRTVSSIWEAFDFAMIHFSRKIKHVGLPSWIINIINYSIFSSPAIKNEQTHYSCNTWQAGTCFLICTTANEMSWWAGNLSDVRMYELCRKQLFQYLSLYVMSFIA